VARPEHDETKLPKYAQNELKRLRHDLARAKRTLSAGPEDSNTFADPYMDRRPLGKDEVIEFVLGPGTDNKIRVCVEGDSINLSGGTALQIEARASNAFSIRIKPWLA